MRISEKARFLTYVQKTETCWLWSGFKMPNGYGLFQPKEGSRLAHRCAYRLFKEETPSDKLDVMHSCDNRACVNPAHLSLGTRKENMEDAKQKNRMVFGDSHGRAKLTTAQIQEIRQAAGLQREIAAKYGIRQSQVSRIKSGARCAQVL